MEGLQNLHICKVQSQGAVQAVSGKSKKVSGASPEDPKFQLRGGQLNFGFNLGPVNRTEEGPKNEVFRETYADFAWRTSNGTGRTRKINRGEGPIDFFL